MLWQAGNAWQRELKTALEPVGITHVQFLLLETLEELQSSGIPATQSRLAVASGSDVMMTSKVLRLLERKKLVGRKSYAKDARANSIVLTPEGAKVLAKAKKIVTANEERFFAKLVTKPGKFVQNLEALAEGK
ncbi:MAG TPA: MarR family transcriptional regulator [Bacteroidia bacterium]|nr:MarR family transcriptional regulator [Bacteroidia bacterium]